MATKRQTKESMCAGLETNGGMITVYRMNPDNTATVCLRTFRVDSVLRFLHRKSLARYSVNQATALKE